MTTEKTESTTPNPPSPRAMEALQIAREMMSVVRQHDVGVLRTREIRSFISPPVLNTERRVALFQQTCEVINLVIPPLVDLLPSVYQLDKKDLTLFKGQLAELLHGCLTGQKVPFNKVPDEKTITDVLKLQRLWPFRAQLVLSVREVARKGLTLSASVRLLKGGQHRGAAVYRQVHEEVLAVKGKLPLKESTHVTT